MEHVHNAPYTINYRFCNLNSFCHNSCYDEMTDLSDVERQMRYYQAELGADKIDVSLRLTLIPKVIHLDINSRGLPSYETVTLNDENAYR